MTYGKIVLILVFFVIASGIQAQPAENGRFQEALNNCLARAGSELIDCARAAALATDTARLEITLEIDLTNDQPDATEDHVLECTTQGNCSLYECYETDNQSVCDFVATCVHEGNLGFNCKGA